MLNRSRVLYVSSFLALFACSSSDGKDNAPPSPSGAGGPHTSGASGSASAPNQPASGSAGAPNQAASGGSSPSFGLGGGGANGGSLAGSGAPSFAGASVGTAGNFAGSVGNGGSGSGGTAGHGNTSTGGGAGSNGRGPAPTFTMIYNTIITSNCGGAMCHLKRPTPFGYDFSSKSAASSSWRSDVVAGDADNSPMFQVLNLAIMPKDKPPLTVDQLFMIYDWINAGALDN